MLNKILNFLVYDKKSKLYTKVLGWDAQSDIGNDIKYGCQAEPVEAI